MRHSRLTVAMFVGGVATFSDLYAIQAVLPAMARQMSVTESTAALAISVATGALAVAVLPWAAVADRVGRGRTMVVATAVAAACGLLLPLSPNVSILLVLRGVSGVALAAVPALAMAHLAEMARSATVATAAGIYIAGTTVGGLAGRLITGITAGLIGAPQGWRWGLLATGVMAAVGAAAFALLLPRGQAPRALPPPGRIKAALADPEVWPVYAQGFLLMGGFVTLYNLVSFRLLDAPYRLPASLVSLMFLIYLVGTLGSSLVGRLTDRFGRQAVMASGGVLMIAGTLLTLARPLAWIIVALVIATFGFFVAHATASGWSGVLVPAARSQATALYSLGYYLGSAALGYVGAVIYTVTEWRDTALVVAAWAACAVVIALVMPAIRPRRSATRLPRRSAPS